MILPGFATIISESPDPVERATTFIALHGWVILA